MNKNSKALSLILYFIFFFGITLIVISFLPLHQLKPFFDYFAPDGNLESLSAKQLNVPRVYGILACIIAWYIFRHRRNTQQYIRNIYDFLLNPGMLFHFIKRCKHAVKRGVLINPKNVLTLIFGFISDFTETIRKEEKMHKYTFLLILVLAIVLRIYYLFQPLRVDESIFFPIYIYDANNGFKGISQLLTHTMYGMHTFYLLLSYITYYLIGNEHTVWVTRLPALIAGILLVPASYAVIRFFHNKNTALLTAGIVASSSVLIFHSTNARGYTIVFFIFLLILALGAYLKNNNNLAAWHLFSIFSAVGFYTIEIFIFAYGVVITWLILSSIVNDIRINRDEFLQNLFSSVILTGLLALILYSPKLLSGSSTFYYKEFQYQAKSWLGFFYQLPISLTNNFLDFSFNIWIAMTPIVICILAIIGFFVALLFHKNLTSHRVPIALSVFISIPIVLLAFKLHTPRPRYFVFLLPLIIGLSSSGIIFLFRPVEQIFKRYWSFIFPSLVIFTTLWLTLVKISEAYLTDGTQIPRYDISHHVQTDNFNHNGEYVEFEFIMTSMKQYFTHLDHTEIKKVLFLFPSSSETEFWIKRMDEYCGAMYCKNIFIYDINSYLHKDSKTCHRLFIFSSESGDALERLLIEQGVSITNYSDPQLMHRFVSANFYKMDIIKECSLK